VWKLWLVSVAIGMIACSCWPVVGWAKDVSVGDAAITLVAQPGYCSMSRERQPDVRAWQLVETTLKGRNRLLDLLADCKELSDWRTGQRQLLDHLVQYQVALKLEGHAFPNATPAVRSVCAATRKFGKQRLQDIFADVRERMAQASSTIRVGEHKILGVLDETPTACFVGLLQSIKTELGTSKQQAVVYATLVVRERLIFFYRFAPYASPDVPAAMLRALKVDVNALLKANE
jgi:hypothetical protein